MDATPPLLNLVVLRSEDVHKAAEFYRTLGLPLSIESHGSGPEHYAASVDGRVFEIYPLTEPHLSTTGSRVGFRVDSVDALVPRLEAIGAEMIVPPSSSPWGRRAVFADFDGHRVELLTPDSKESESLD
ncbi:MAG: VOC family protein [Planctomycetales bacterium]